MTWAKVMFILLVLQPLLIASLSPFTSSPTLTKVASPLSHVSRQVPPTAVSSSLTTATPNAGPNAPKQPLSNNGRPSARGTRPNLWRNIQKAAWKTYLRAKFKGLNLYHETVKQPVVSYQYVRHQAYEVLTKEFPDYFGDKTPRIGAGPTNTEEDGSGEDGAGQGCLTENIDGNNHPGEGGLVPYGTDMRSKEKGQCQNTWDDDYDFHSTNGNSLGTTTATVESDLEGWWQTPGETGPRGIDGVKSSEPTSAESPPSPTSTETTETPRTISHNPYAAPPEEQVPHLVKWCTGLGVKASRGVIGAGRRTKNTVISPFRSSKVPRDADGSSTDTSSEWQWSSLLINWTLVYPFLKIIGGQRVWNSWVLRFQGFILGVFTTFGAIGVFVILATVGHTFLVGFILRLPGAKWWGRFIPRPQRRKSRRYERDLESESEDRQPRRRKKSHRRSRSQKPTGAALKMDHW